MLSVHKALLLFVKRLLYEKSVEVIEYDLDQCVLQLVLITNQLGVFNLNPLFPFQIEISFLKIHKRRKGRRAGRDLVRSEADMSAASLRGPKTWILSALRPFFDIK